MKQPLPAKSGFACWTREKIRNRDTDQFGHVNNAAIATFMEAGRMELFAGLDMKGGNILVVRMLSEFHKELFYPGEVEIGTAVSAVGNSSFSVVQGLYDATGCFATGEATCVFFDSVAGKAIRIPEQVRTQLTRYHQAEHSVPEA
jgi:acyl-CoA thioester hydrolase